MSPKRHRMPPGRPAKTSPGDHPLSLQTQLLAYFKLDQRVRAMRSRLDAAMRRQAAQERKLGQLQQQAQELTAQYKQSQAHAATLESEASEMESKVTTLRDRMNSVTNNKEYSALLVEVNTGKIEQGKLEEQAIDALNKSEELKAQLDALEARVQEQSRLVEGAVTDVAEARAEVGDQLETLNTERDTAGESISPAARKLFDRLCIVHDGEAMAGIEEQNKRRMEYTCEGCYTMIPVETVNALITRPDEVIGCSNCERILYIPEEIRNALGAAKS